MKRKKKNTLESCPGYVGLQVRMLSEMGKDTHTHAHIYKRHIWCVVEEEAHCAEERSMEGSGHVKRGKAETSRRLFSVSLFGCLEPSGQCFVKGTSF